MGIGQNIHETPILPLKKAFISVRNVASVSLKPSSHGCDLNMRLMLHHKAPTGRMR